MADSLEIGSVVHIGSAVRIDSEARFEWVIPDFPKLLKKRIRSPRFRLSDSSWYLSIHTVLPRIQKSAGFIFVDLHKEFGTPKTISYTVSFKGINHMLTGSVKTGIEGEVQSICGFYITWKKQDFPFPDNALTITCFLKNDKCHELKGENFLSPVIQPEVSEGVSCSKENSSVNEEGALLDLKDFALLSEHLKNLLINGSDYDVRICVKNKEFPAHRNILKARSPVFAMMLSHDTKENNTGAINIEDCEPEAFGDFLLYVYTGKTDDLTIRKALNLYYAADKYDFPVLKERCVSVLKTSLSVSSICDVILLAAKHEEKELLKTAKEFLAQNIKEILLTVEWQRFMSANPVEANELYINSLEILFKSK